LQDKKTIIAVIGAAKCSSQESVWAEEVGEELAKRGAAVICGGLTGVMESVCRGARKAGGLTIGVLPGDIAESANRYVDIPLVTGLGYARNVIVVKSAQAAIAIGGSYGTLSEIAFACQRRIPVIGLDTWEMSRGGKADDTIIRAGSPREAVALALSKIDRSSPSTGEVR
jgi:uncharacterized protein (TIGR00725 family)